LILPLGFAVAAHEVVISIWAMGGMTLFSVVLLSSPLLMVPRPAVRAIVAGALVFPLVALALSPVIALVIHHQGVPNYSSHYRGVAQAMEQAWAQTTARPPRFVGSYNNLLYGVLFYLPADVVPLEIVNPRLTPWVDGAQVVRDGIALVCPVAENPCMQALAARGTGGTRSEVEITRRYWGTDDEPDRFVIVIVPPQK
jgi:hypothetical protein